jgi:tetratricopeptide (TPR) repeat protein
MSDGAFSDRLTQLRNRWEADPSSRIFLQLAEEYRHQGRIKEALAVLDRGLREHPGYLSALVAKGRCHLELGEPEAARGVLERVVKQDATQMVANKLLVRAYLDTGEADKARERLDLYSLLNDSDPEIEELRRRLRAMEQPPQAPPTSDRSFAEAPPPATGGDVFDLGFTPPPAPVRHGGDDLFALDLPAPRPAPAAPAPAAAPPAAPAAAVAAAPAVAEEPEPEGVVFPGLGSRESRSRYLNALAAEGLFAFEPAPAPEVAPAGMAEDARDIEELEETTPVAGLAWEEPAPEAEAPVFDLEEATPWAAEPAPLFSEPAPPAMEPAFEEPPFEPIAEPIAEPLAEPIAPPPAAEPAATATLGEIYLRQGHLGEAKRIFDEVLRREPDNPAAHEGLLQLASRRQERRPLEGRDLLAGYEPGEEGGEAEAKARKVFLLNSYLTRLRRGGQRDVS